ncbi:2,3-bisphosphoglycerate-independent phosphoglycerate mutase [Alphaproteobacteria bacterium KMM 3653]|uniref:2,3-bisphosphoglycerate-independent phosphoglycerate mutase n=1 Tax=Harenicola maris TaxID=2841044 RepID=A0AAP2CPV6_9RHOB|nr:2,3-bisphosphoglycerate-independent phosphoglycerate mutase [Harenicola maris]
MADKRPVILCILDGWGLSDQTEANAPALAETPVFDGLMAANPHATLTTFGLQVGLPKGQMGNSEVGHTNIGAGRTVAMDLGQIDLAIEDGSFAKNPAILAFAQVLKVSGGTAHLMGVVSDGGVHGHIDHIIAACQVMSDQGVPVALHAITDGRDVAPKSADTFMADLQDRLPEGCKVVTVTGRYFAMDRDNRWDRVERAYRAMVQGQGEAATSAEEAVQMAFDRGETDEFIAPTVIDGYGGMQGGDGVFCLNFRADRAREILQAMGDKDFDAFDTSGHPPFAAFLGMVDYSTDHSDYMTTAYPKQNITNTLGQWVSAHGLTQFRVAETEKYPHVTFFLNGGREEPFEGETRTMPPSPKVATYDLAPEMSAAEVADAVVGAIGDGIDMIVVNFANPDMVGHTGDLAAAMRACEAVDKGLGRIVEALGQTDGAMIVTADHGNCELMVDPETGGAHTAHTLNPVPVILVGGPEGATLRSGCLGDLAPTVLSLLGLSQPAEMTGVSLLLP